MNEEEILSGVDSLWRRVDLAKRLNWSLDKVHKLMATEPESLPPCIRLTKRIARWDPKDVEAWLEARKGKFNDGEKS